MQRELELYFDRLWPLNRSILGEGFRQSLDVLAEIMPTDRLRYPTGKQVFDWTIPKEWKVHEAYFEGPDGKRYADFSKNNLHLIGYSISFRGTVGLDELKKHLYTVPEMPEAIPYVTSYYEERWGFCISQETFDRLPEGDYYVHIDTRHEAGHLEIGEAILSGRSEREVFFSTYLCHPSMANNELSGPLVMAYLFKYLQERQRRKYTYRFTITSETIGAIAYLSTRGKYMKSHVDAGFQMTCLGNPKPFTYKKTKNGNSLADRATLIALRGSSHTVVPFHITGSDERQYSSAGFNLPMGSLMRTMYDQYPEYHTSLDDKSFISFDALQDSIKKYCEIVEIIESNYFPRNLSPYGEPQLSKRGLYPTLSKYSAFNRDPGERYETMMWLLSYADGTRDLIGIAEETGCDYWLMNEIAADLVEKKLLQLDEKPNPI